MNSCQYKVGDRRAFLIEKVNRPSDGMAWKWERGGDYIDCVVIEGEPRWDQPCTCVMGRNPVEKGELVIMECVAVIERNGHSLWEVAED